MNDKVAKFSVPYDKEHILSVPSSQKITYRADEDGIREITDTYNQFGDSMYATSRLVLSKEVFIAAYNAYIKNKPEE